MKKLLLISLLLFAGCESNKIENKQDQAFLGDSRFDSTLRSLKKPNWLAQPTNIEWVLVGGLLHTDTVKYRKFLDAYNSYCLTKMKIDSMKIVDKTSIHVYATMR